MVEINNGFDADFVVSRVVGAKVVACLLGRLVPAPSDGNALQELVISLGLQPTAA